MAREVSKSKNKRRSFEIQVSIVICFSIRCRYASKAGDGCSAAAPGYVAWSRVGRQYGNYVMIIHTNGLATLYAHLSRSFVSADQFVQRGEEIGAVGSTGLSTGPHLHFEVRKNGIPTDPIPFLRDE